VEPDTANLTPHTNAGCCHLANLVVDPMAIISL